MHRLCCLSAVSCPEAVAVVVAVVAVRRMASHGPRPAGIYASSTATGS